MPGVPAWYPGDPPWIEPPDVLYHYTTATGLRGIVESRNARATEISFLNDSREIDQALDLFEEAAPRVLERMNNDSSELRRLWEDVVERFRALDVFVFCLSASSDDLSQWRAYSRGTGGYALGFDGFRLAKIAEQQGFRLAPCMYSGPISEAAIVDKRGKLHPVSDIVEATLWQAFTRLGEAIEGERDEGSTLEEIVWAISEIAPRLKHASFEQEREWRLISNPDLTQVEDRAKTRDGEMMPIPYYPISLPEAVGSSEPVIQSILVGPATHQSLSVRAVRKLFRYADWHEPAIVKSDIPFRDL